MFSMYHEFMLLLIYIFSFHFQSGGNSLNYYLIQTVSQVHFSVTPLGI